MARKCAFLIYLCFVVLALHFQGRGTGPVRQLASEESCKEIADSIVNSLPATHKKAPIEVNELGALRNTPSAFFSTSDKDHAALMLDMIKKEQKSISLAYYQTDGNKVGNVLFAALADAAERGVKVRILLDAWNPDDWIDTPVKLETLKALEDLGIEVKFFNNVERTTNKEKILSFLQPDKFNRMHDKVAIFESENFLITGDRMPQNSNFRIQKRKGATTRDENLKVTYAFNYLSVMAAVRSEEVVRSSMLYYQDLWKLGAAKDLSFVDEVKVANRKKKFSKFLQIAEEADFNSQLETMYKSFRPIDGAEFVSDSINKHYDPFVLGVSKSILGMFKEAKEEIVVFSPYMNYTPEYLQEIYAAILRGVKITLVVPSWESIDTPLTLQLWEGQARELRARGVTILQHKGQDFMHAKVAMVDRKKTFVGSYNFNPRSTFTDHESGVIVNDLEFGRSVHAFKEYLAQNESTPFKESEKSLLDKIKISLIKKLLSWSFFLYRQF